MNSILYLLVNEEKSSFKIGITDNLETRHARLSAVWGVFDLASSCTVSGTRHDISRLEKTLHYLLEKWRIQQPIKAEGHREWFSMDCFDKALELISSAARIRGTDSEKIITTGIVLSKPIKTPKKKIQDGSSYDVSLAELKRLWPYYEEATVDFREGSSSQDRWLWTINISGLPISPYNSLCFQINSHSIAVPISYSYSKDTPWIIKISLSKTSLAYMGKCDGFQEAYNFLNEMLPKLAAIKQAL